MWQERQNDDDDPLALAMRVALSARSHTSRYLRGLLDHDVNDVELGIERLENEIRTSASSRLATYMVMNPTLDVHDVYKSRAHVNEQHRMAFTRFRISGHSLAVEVGRWNRRGRGRLPLEERLCSCGAVQSELHVLEDCPLTQHIRDMYSFNNLQQVMNYNTEKCCEILYKVLSLYY